MRTNANPPMEMKILDAIVLLGGLALGVLMVMWVRSAVLDEQEDRERCRALVTTSSHFADPVTKTCGVRVRRAMKGVREEDALTPCPAILALPEFEAIRHCWAP